MVSHAVAFIIALLAVVSVARADEPTETVEEREDVEGAPPNEHVPLLELDPSLFSVSSEGYDEKIARLALSPDFELQLAGEWKTLDAPLMIARGESELVRGWRAGARATYNLGWARVTVYREYELVANELGRGSSTNTGLDITRTFRISKDVTGFIGLSLGHIKWRDGKPVPGSFDATRFAVSAGLRWR